MGNSQSIIDINSSCDWIPNSIIKEQVSEIESFKTDYNVETQLFDNLAQRISNIDGVGTVFIENPRKRWFRARRITVSVLPPRNKFNLKGRGVSSPFTGVKLAMQYINKQHITDIGTSIYPAQKGHSLYIKQKVPLLKFMKLERNIPVPHFSLLLQYSEFPICDEHYKTTEIKFTFTPTQKQYKVSLFSYLRLKKEIDDIQKINNYFAFGLNVRHSLTGDSHIARNDEKQLRLKVQQKADLFGVFGDDDSLIPALKYRVHLAGKLPPNIVLRVDAGTILSPVALPLAERFLLGGSTTLRCVPPQHFSNEYGDQRVGCEHYITIGSDLKIPLAKKQKIDLLLYANTGVGLKLNESLINENTYDPVPSLVHLTACGFGISMSQWKVNLETSFGIPLGHSYGLKTINYQINLTENDV